MQSNSELSFLNSLLDVKVASFITMRVIRVIYVILVTITMFVGTLATFAGLLMIFFGDRATGFLMVLLAPLGTLLCLIIIRLWVEFLANLYRIGDNTQKMVNALPAE